MNMKGSEGILSDKNNETKLRELIVAYDEEVNLKAKIAYKDIFDYVKKAYDVGKINFYPSYTWWKTKGKKLVDEYNVVRKKTVIFAKKDQIDVIDLVDLVEKHYRNKKELLNQLLPYGKLVDRMVERISVLEENLQEQTARIMEKDIIINGQIEKIQKQEKLIDSFFLMHLNNEVNIQSIMNVKKAIPEETNSALSETFGNPSIYINEFIIRNNITEEPKNSKISNVINLKNEKTHTNKKKDHDW